MVTSASAHERDLGSSAAAAGSRDSEACRLSHASSSRLHASHSDRLHERSMGERHAHGWEYAVAWSAPWGGESSETHVRRRRWSRRRRSSDELAELRERFLAIDVSMDGPSVLVGICDGELRPPPYVIDNQTSVQLTMQQKGAPQKRKVLAAHDRTMPVTPRIT